MPITQFQLQVFQILRHRNADSYVAGGTAINRSLETIRYSNDVDLFHDSDEAVSSAYAADCQSLQERGYAIEVLIAQPSFYRVIVSKGAEQLKLEWVRDTAFRFFPVGEDEVMGFRLHDCDLAVNKCLALANRTEIRDAIDILQLDSRVLSLAACCWAACGKDPGFTPHLVLDMIQRHLSFTPDMLAAESLNKPIDPVQFKKDLLRLVARAKTTIDGLPPADVGCLYITKDRSVLKDPDGKSIQKCSRHYGSVKGSWPRVVGD